MQVIDVKTNQPYKVHIGEGLLQHLADFLPLGLTPCKAVLVTDDNVEPLYAPAVTKTLTAAGFTVFQYVIPHGEGSKSQTQLFSLLEFMAQNRINRSDCLFALGGGVVGDLTGFAASIYLRGVAFVQLPTTLLAACDSSVGGKTAINLPAGKNLVGSFYQPRAVICDTATFATLPAQVFCDGMAEVIKYGMIADRALLLTLQKGVLPYLETVLARCVEIKAHIVEQDTFDTSVRQLLNFGHTVGHAVEAASDFTIPHGNGVAIGMATVCRAWAALGHCKEDIYDCLRELLQKYGLPDRCHYSAETLWNMALSDKKSTQNGVQLIVPAALGNCKIAPVSSQELLAVLKAGLA